MRNVWKYYFLEVMKRLITWLKQGGYYIHSGLKITFIIIKKINIFLTDVEYNYIKYPHHRYFDMLKQKANYFISPRSSKPHRLTVPNIIWLIS